MRTSAEQQPQLAPLQLQRQAVVGAKGLQQRPGAPQGLELQGDAVLGPRRQPGGRAVREAAGAVEAHHVGPWKDTTGAG